MGRELVTTVILTDENGAPVIFNPGDTPEKKYADQIDNPKAWGEAVKADEDEVADVPVEEADPEEGSADSQGDDDDAPAKSANKQEWVDYAASRGVELEDGASKKDYQDAVAAL